MVFDFDSTRGNIYVDGKMDGFVRYRLKLVSLYNNKGLENTTLGEIALTRVNGTTRWTLFSYDFIGTPFEDITNQDANGYYMAYFEGEKLGIWSTLAKYPAKVKTEFTESYPQQYASPNEDNEQYVYYRQ
jgi:hypothetical protein